MTRRKKPKALADFAARITAAGGEILGTTNPYELLRFRTSLGVGVIYTGKRGEKWNLGALAVRDHLDAGKGSLSPVPIQGRCTGKDTVNALLKRDGDACFFCGAALDSDITVEHLVPVSHGGPNHVSNLLLAHARCNQRAGHMSGVEKVAMAIAGRCQ